MRGGRRALLGLQIHRPNRTRLSCSELHKKNRVCAQQKGHDCWCIQTSHSGEVWIPGENLLSVRRRPSPMPRTLRSFNFFYRRIALYSAEPFQSEINPNSLRGNWQWTSGKLRRRDLFTCSCKTDQSSPEALARSLRLQIRPTLNLTFTTISSIVILCCIDV